MKLLLAIVMSTLLPSCGAWFPKANPTYDEDLKIELEKRRFMYVQLGKKHVNKNGWILADTCDSILWSSLAAVGRESKIDILSARDSKGQWYRTPSKDCYPSRSASTISRDMFMGLFLYMYVNKEIDMVESLWEYGKNNGWDMGDAKDLKTKLGRTKWTPSTIGLLARIRYDLTGNDDPARYSPVVYSTKPGFTSHLSLISILLQGEIYENISAYQLKVLNSILDHSPTNVLALAIHAKYTDGNLNRAIEELLSQYPAGRLPNGKKDWCEEWRPQRADNDNGLFPCKNGKEHTGADFIFVATYILKDL